MHFQSQLILKLTLGTFLIMWAPVTAKMAGNSAALNNLLQREYAEPVIFPNHQVERKAQRSPSLRLRFGRRSDPDVISHAIAKRWFDEVNQKPIRSPSLRLRFGRRSDPSMPMHSPLDIIMNEAYENQMDHDLFDNYIDDNDVAAINKEDELYNTLMQSQKLRDHLMLLSKYAGIQDSEGLSPASEISSSPLEEDTDEFKRIIRKSGGPLRLRWGRSTAGLRLVEANGDNATNDVVQKNKLADISNEVEKSLSTQNKD